jgi:hypothetical protein
MKSDYRIAYAKKLIENQKMITWVTKESG